MKKIYHIAERQVIEKARQIGFYQVESLFTEGFIHCSTETEVVNTANRRFLNRKDLLLLCMDESQIASRVVHENLQGGAVMYPHIYGVLNLDAIVGCYYFTPNADGKFDFPTADNAFDFFIAESHFLSESIKLFQQQKLLCERAMLQVRDADLFYSPNEVSNSIAILVQHMSGNMVSRWSDFLTSDGEKPNRARDTEFEIVLKTRADLMQVWEQGWKVLFNTLESLSGKDMLRLVYIRGEAHTAMKAMLRQIEHYAQHSGQVVYLAKLHVGPTWKTLSIAKGKSQDFKP